MTLEQLRIFVAVAEREHIRRAAEHVHLSQSAVSHAVVQLEREFGLRFFDRIGRRIELTDTGRAFLDEARATLGRADAARARLLDLGGLRQGVLHVHASHTIASYWLPARLNGFHALHPDIQLSITIANTAEVSRKLRSGEASLGLVEGDLPAPDLTSEVVARDQLVLVVAPDHPWADTPPRPEDLYRSAWVLREQGSGTRLEFENDLKRLGVDPAKLKVMMEVASNEAMASAVETGRAATVLSASVVAGRIEAGLLRQVPLALPERQFRMIRHPKRSLSPTEAAFVAMLRAGGPQPDGAAKGKR
ncbi:LysR substrate-binding domain-containing protein [Sphingomonas sp. NFR15]|uniref:LysR substrate-binding domain-containing protein n=1 Tax=Sphingomonas sp. NFR15 TaxID=1566282 RepID=UPI00088062B2|nr:LysR substrate-binding domain-containing protein [Sphingomonas sp. NFR15]SDA24426.1 DNA-binding transcriptional regulator, LysR family [Sphingomonas sp. NFR15]